MKQNRKWKNMPEKPEVITVAKKLESKIIGKKIKKVNVLYERIIEYPKVQEFTNKIINQTREGFIYG